MENFDDQEQRRFELTSGGQAERKSVTSDFVEKIEPIIREIDCEEQNSLFSFAEPETFVLREESIFGTKPIDEESDTDEKNVFGERYSGVAAGSGLMAQGCDSGTDVAASETTDSEEAAGKLSGEKNGGMKCVELNTDCLLEILKRCTPRTICNFSLTNSTTNALINRRYKWLPRENMLLEVRANCATEMFTYRYLSWDKEHTFLESEEIHSRKFDILEVEHGLRYAFVWKIEIYVEGGEWNVEFMKRTIRNVHLIRAIEMDFEWTTDGRLTCHVLNYYTQEACSLLNRYCEEGLYLQGRQGPDISEEDRKDLDLLHYSSRNGGQFYLNDVICTTQELVDFVRFTISISSVFEHTFAEFCMKFKVSDPENVFPKFDDFFTKLREEREVERLVDEEFKQANMVHIDGTTRRGIYHCYTEELVLFAHTLHENDADADADADANADADADAEANADA